ncbi:hypothetical protein H8K43_09635 [Undibacterium sp. CY22W]|uniref:Teneurin-like YD-shell domain-containing protein n=1 Tax=Undibacterium curvum TaxID=2762294 RepID=A0ABR7A5I8_9BURK|nr:hypothetical protein [Undibacterium curvum]
MSKVDFFNGTTNIASLTQPPFTTQWNNVSAGSYTLTATATDNLGASTVSSPVIITVTSHVAKVFDIHTDHLNTPRVITDSNGTPVWRWDSAPFGETLPDENPQKTGSTSNFVFNLRFAGQYFDRETNLHYNYFRDYDPQTGRYIQSDPIGLRGGLNAYLFDDANPISNTDPLGLSTYQCIRGLGQKPGGYVSPDNITHHQYSCIVFPNGTSICGGQGPSGNPISSPGKPTTPDEDYFDKNSCKKTQDDNQCFEKCMQNEWSKPRPWYSVIPSMGTQCQQYDNNANATCRKKCGL